MCVVSLLVFLALDAPGDVLLPDNGQGWEPRHAVEREREREDWLECQSVPDESEGLVVTPPDYITIRPNTVKQHRLASKHSRQYTHSSSAIKSCLLTSAVISIVLENFSSQNRSKNV